MDPKSTLIQSAGVLQNLVSTINTSEIIPDPDVDRKILALSDETARGITLCISDIAKTLTIIAERL